MLEKEGTGWLVLNSPANILYTCGIEVPFWPAFMGDMADGFPMMTALVEVGSGAWCLLASDFYRSRLKKAGVGGAVYFSAFSHLKNISPKRQYEEALSELALRIPKGSRVGVEMHLIPAFQKQALCQRTESLVDAWPWLQVARRIKTPVELSALEQVAKVADRAQERLMEIAERPGSYTELEIWFEVQKTVCAGAGQLTPFVGELVAGPRTGLSDYPLGPSAYQVQPGDAGIMDVSPRVNGFWADCSNAVVFWQTPNAEQRRYFQAVKTVYEAGVKVIRPGLSFGALYREMERAYQEAGLAPCGYQGHLIGANMNETPRVTAFEEELLQEDMVLCIEPQAYTGPGGKTGVRLEKMLHITAGGARELNQFSWGLDRG